MRPCVQENWAERIQAIKRLIFTWEKTKKRIFFKSIVEKICIIKTFLISQLVYIMQALVIPDHVLTDIKGTLLLVCLEEAK